MLLIGKLAATGRCATHTLIFPNFAGKATSVHANAGKATTKKCDPRDTGLMQHKRAPTEPSHRLRVTKREADVMGPY